MVQRVEELAVLATAEEVEVGDLKIAPVVAVVPAVAEGVVAFEPTEESTKRVGYPHGINHGVPRRRGGQPAGTLVVACATEQRGCGVATLPERHGVAVLLAVARHLDKGITEAVSG